MLEPFAAESLHYRPSRHAYQRTDDYLFSQLIPYIGSKRRLLGLIHRAAQLTGVDQGTFADYFAGSGVVSRYAKSRGFRVVANDWEPYAFVLNSAAISLNAPPCSDALFDYLNALPGIDGYITRHYCPKDDDFADPLSERMYYKRSNGMKIDAIRTEVAGMREGGEIDDQQTAYLLAPLIAAACYTSNTSGVFKAYHAGWGGRTGTALYRILSDLTLNPIPLIDNGQCNQALALDAEMLAHDWDRVAGEPASLVYLDPPYNQHPYGSNYHILNSIALWDCPPVPTIDVAKSAIRSDWRTERRSAFNTTALALPSLSRLIDAIYCRWILLSYSTDGNIPVTELVAAFAERGTVSVVAGSYKRYRVSTQRMSTRSHNVEFVLILDKDGKPGGGQDFVLSEISRAAKL